MLVEARQILEKTKDAIRNALEAAKSSAKQITIGVNPCAEVKIIPTVLPIFEARFPEIRVILHSLSSTDQITALHNRAIEIGFMRKIGDSMDVVTEPVLRDKILVLLPANHSLTKLKRIPPAKLLPFPYVSVLRVNGPNLYETIESFCSKAGMHFRMTQSSGNVLGSLNMVAANLGFTLAPDYVLSILPKNVVARPLDCVDPPTIDLICAYRRDKLSPSLKVFLATLREFISGKYPDDGIPAQ
jgi:DNA-binding transcriptional LysR family regulator